MKTILNKKQLDDLLSYTNEDVLCRFTDMYEVDQTEAEDILKETLKFLYISQLPETFIPDDLLIIDAMWHNMILFTPEYNTFSHQYFGEYFHHVPARKKEKEEREKRRLENPEEAKTAYLSKLETLISITYDNLGEQTVRKWYEEYPVKYSKENIKSLRK